MRKIKNIICTLIFLFVFCEIISIFIPELAGAFDLLLKIEWIVMKAFFFEDLFKTLMVWIFFAIILSSGIYMSKKKERKIWILSAFVVDVIGYIFIFIGK